MQDPETGENVLLHETTGEVMEAVEIMVPRGTITRSPDEQEAHRKLRERERSRKARREETDIWGTFCFVNREGHFDDMKPENVTKLMYLSTYTGYSGSLMLTERSKMTQDCLETVLGVSEATVQRFLAEAEGQYLIHKGDMLYLDKKTFVRGMINRLSYEASYVKLCRNGMRGLYTHAGRHVHRQIGYLFQMLPFLNTEYNMLCWSPSEKDPDRIYPMTLKEFCSHIGYNTRNMKRLAESYDRIVFPYDGHEERFCSILGDRSEPETTRIYLNPHVLYSGKHPKEVLEAGHFTD